MAKASEEGLGPKRAVVSLLMMMIGYVQVGRVWFLTGAELLSAPSCPHEFSSPLGILSRREPFSTDVKLLKNKKGCLLSSISEDSQPRLICASMLWYWRAESFTAMRITNLHLNGTNSDTVLCLSRIIRRVCRLGPIHAEILGPRRLRKITEEIRNILASK